MKIQIYCSIGEVADKITILNIKKSKTNDINKLKNIQTELDYLTKSMGSNEIPENLYRDLFNINQFLWDCKDNIRLKSSKKEFDNQYLILTEQIHISNDKRYLIKKRINEYFDSEILEEKIYTKADININISDVDKYKKYYSVGRFEDSYNGLKNIIINNSIDFENNLTNKNIDILVSYLTCCSTLNYNFEFLDIYRKLLEKLDHLNIGEEFQLHIKKSYLFYILGKGNYVLAKPYIKYFGNATFYSMNYKNTCFIENDKDVQFVYFSGGLGDHIMLVRLIKILCNKYPNNKIIFLTMSPIKWLMKHIMRENKNLIIIDSQEEFISMKLLNIITKHCSIFELINFLNISKDDIYNNFTPSVKDIVIYDTFNLEKIKSNSYVFNWKGNSTTLAYPHHRKMQLYNAERLFKLSHIQFVIINKEELSDEEKIIIEKYDNIYYIGNQIDKNEAFVDTISIMRKVKGVITTDTSIIHLSANLDVPSYLCLTYCAEWRWGRSEKCIWYPNIKMLRQNKIGIWDNVIDDLINIIK